MGDRSAGYFRFRRKLLVGYLILCALLASLTVWKVVSSYLADRTAATAVTQSSAGAMAAHVEEIIDSIDQPLHNSAIDISVMEGKPMKPESIQPLLAASSRTSDSRFWLLFIDAVGKGVVASNGLAVNGVSFADRSYFRDAATKSGGEPHVGGPVYGRVSKRKVFFLSRRVDSPSGKFLGVVAAPVDVSLVAKVFEKSRLGPAMSIALLTLDYRVIDRAPLFEESFGADLTSLAESLSPLTKSAGIEADSPFTGERRLYSSARVGSLPLVVVVGVSRDTWMAGFRSDLIAGTAGLLVALVVAFFSGKFALDQYQKLERVEEAQRILIAQLGAAKEELAREERRLRVIADAVPARVAYINADERYTFHNFGEHGAPIGALMGKTLLETHGAEIYALIKDDARRALAGEPICVERSYTSDGGRRYFKHQYTPDLLPSGRAIGFHAMVTDITGFKTIQQRLSAIARVDSLTGLPNRAELLDRLESALARCRRTGASLACLYLDIDRFKEVNDTLGHSGGDIALVEFGRRLRHCVRETDLVARLAGDEFVILLEGLTQPAEAERVAEKVIECMAMPFNIEGAPWPVTTSVGVVVADAMTDDSGSLLRAADEALYSAKRAGRNRMSAHGESEASRKLDG